MSEEDISFGKWICSKVKNGLNDEQKVNLAFVETIIGTGAFAVFSILSILSYRDGYGIVYILTSIMMSIFLIIIILHGVYILEVEG